MSEAPEKKEVGLKDIFGYLKSIDQRIAGLRFPSIFGEERGRCIFKTKVVRNLRLSIPKPEAEAANIREGDLVQVILEKIEKPEA